MQLIDLGLQRVVLNGWEPSLESQGPEFTMLAQTDIVHNENLPSDRPARLKRASNRSRRLSDKVLDAFNSACDQRELDAAGRLLRILELMLKRRPMGPPVGIQRLRDREAMVAAHELLWRLRHPNAGETSAGDPLQDDGMDCLTSGPSGTE